ncbi:MAG: UTP--glucose-1-phosphate uridylyltransferase, partial [Thermodesulfobacteriota bacterium]|nr:UTP--glucose-1-phosphate uridylyltransferase [Thermodesulfobacteriota bacterium]
DAFMDIRRYRYFNTNNIWVNLERLQAIFEKEGAIHLPIIINPKTLDPRDENSPPVYQIETAMGAAVALFDDASAVRVPRSRFMPVKKCNDLMAVRSDCYLLNTEFKLHQNPDRTLPSIRIQLDKRYFQKIDDFDARFANGVPSLIDCDSLIVEGDVTFEADVAIKGPVTIKNNGHRQVTIRSGVIVDNDYIV